MAARNTAVNYAAPLPTFIIQSLTRTKLGGGHLSFVRADRAENVQRLEAKPFGHHVSAEEKCWIGVIYWSDISGDGQRKFEAPFSEEPITRSSVHLVRTQTGLDPQNTC